jgi:hypothetical protein
MVKDSALVPFLMVGGTDNRFFRRAGAVGYGFALFSERLAHEDFASMFHGNDERVDAESLGLTEQLWRAGRGDVGVSERPKSARGAILEHCGCGTRWRRTRGSRCSPTTSSTRTRPAPSRVGASR